MFIAGVINCYVNNVTDDDKGDDNVKMLLDKIIIYFNNILLCLILNYRYKPFEVFNPLWNKKTCIISSDEIINLATLASWKRFDEFNIFPKNFPTFFPKDF